MWCSPPIRPLIGVPRVSPSDQIWFSSSYTVLFGGLVFSEPCYHGFQSKQRLGGEGLGRGKGQDGFWPLVLAPVKRWMAALLFFLRLSLVYVFLFVSLFSFFSLFCGWFVFLCCNCWLLVFSFPNRCYASPLSPVYGFSRPFVGA